MALAACYTRPTFEIPKKQYTVAVLPLYNETADLDGPVLVRQLFDEKLRPYYRTVPIDTVDKVLRDEAGVTLGGQLAMMDPRKLGEILEVDGLVYGYLLNFEDVKTVFYNVRKVRAAFKLVDAKTGTTVWARGQGVRSVTGMIDVVTSDERLQEFMRIKGIDTIPGVNQWYDRVNVPSMLKQDARSIFLIPFIAAADTVLSLGTQVGGNMSGRHLYTFADEVTNRILYEVLRVSFALLDKPQEARRLVFPVFALYRDVDFTAHAVLKTKDLSTYEEAVSQIVLRKKGCRLRSDRIIGDNRFSVIVNSKSKQGIILLPESKQYTELDLKEADFENVYIERVYMEEEAIGGKMCSKSRLTVIYGDTSVQEGVLWESKEPRGMIKKMRLRNKNSRIDLEMVDIDTAVPSDDDFQVPSGYARVPPQW